MSTTATVQDGKIIDTTASSISLSNSTESTGGSSLDKDAFLQLLVAEMQNQDPLEPTTNTEYISQFATFSQLEEMQNVSSSVDMSRAQSLVGQEVFLDVTDSSGNTTQVCGRVDYVVMQEGKVYVSVDDSLYSFDDVTTVLDSDYWEAYNLAYSWTSDLSNLTSLTKLTLADETDITALRETYDGMTDYQKTFIASDSVKLLESYEEKIEELHTAEDSNSDSDEEEEEDEETVDE